MKNGNLIVELEGNNGADEYDTAKSINQMPSYIVSDLSGHSKLKTVNEHCVFGK